jgi:hypothetical protein
MNKIIISLLLLILLTACIVTPPMITDIHRDGDDLVFYKAAIQVNTLTYETKEINSREVRVSIK